MNEQERFTEGNSVVVVDMTSPFYRWAGVVNEVAHNANGWPFYQVKCEMGTPTITVLPTFADPQLAHAG